MKNKLQNVQSKGKTDRVELVYNKNGLARHLILYYIRITLWAAQK